MFGLGVLTVTVLLCLVIALPIAVLSMHQNVVIALLSAFVVAFLMARAASIIAYKGAEVPLFGKNVFMGTFLVIIAVWGISRLANRAPQGGAMGGGGGLRRRLNFDMRQVAGTFAVGAVVVIAVFMIFSSFNLNFGNLSDGLDKVWDESPAYKQTAAEIEAFLRK